MLKSYRANKTNQKSLDVFSLAVYNYGELKKSPVSVDGHFTGQLKHLLRVYFRARHTIISSM